MTDESAKRAARSPVITRDELEWIIDTMVSDHLAYLRDFMDPKATRYDGKNFHTEVSTLISIALANHGFCWARVPTPKDDLWNGFLQSLYDNGQATNAALVSEKEDSRRVASRHLAEHVMRQWRTSGTTVVRRKISGD